MMRDFRECGLPNTMTSETKQAIMAKLLAAPTRWRCRPAEVDTFRNYDHVVEMFEGPCFPDNPKILDCVVVTRRKSDKWEFGISNDDDEPDTVSITVYTPRGSIEEYTRNFPMSRTGFPDYREGRKELYRDIAGVRHGFNSVSNYNSVAHMFENELYPLVSEKTDNLFNTAEVHGFTIIRTPIINSVKSEALQIIHIVQGSKRVTAVLCHDMNMAELHYNNYDFFAFVRIMGKLSRE
jgi:hypothetical protein